MVPTWTPSTRLLLRARRCSVMRKVPPRPDCDRAIVVCALSLILLATLASSQAAVGVAMIRQVHILGTEGGIEVEIPSSRPVAPETTPLSVGSESEFPEVCCVPLDHFKTEEKHEDMLDHAVSNAQPYSADMFHFHRRCGGSGIRHRTRKRTTNVYASACNLASAEKYY